MGLTGIIVGASWFCFRSVDGDGGGIGGDVKHGCSGGPVAVGVVEDANIDAVVVEVVLVVVLVVAVALLHVVIAMVDDGALPISIDKQSYRMGGRWSVVYIYPPVPLPPPAALSV